MMLRIRVAALVIASILLQADGARSAGPIERVEILCVVYTRRRQSIGPGIAMLDLGMESLDTAILQQVSSARWFGPRQCVVLIRVV